MPASVLHWVLKAVCGGQYFGFYTAGKEDITVDPTTAAGMAAPALDPIEVAGQAHIGSMLEGAEKKGWEALLPALRLIRIDELSVIQKYYRPDSGLWAHSREQPPAERYVNARKYGSHMRTLQGVKDEQGRVKPQSRLLNEVGPEEGRIRFYSGYFHVEKVGAEGRISARSIFNGKKLSEEFLPAPRVNIPSMTGFIREVRRVQQRHPKKRLYTVIGDFRHWFHQIPVSQRLQDHFGLMCRWGKKRYRYVWRCLPMGWSYSPWIAQSCSWYLMAATGVFDDSVLRAGPHARADELQLPTVLRTGKEGFGTVYYDNFILVTPCEKEAAEFSRRMKVLCSKDEGGLHVEIKKDSFVETGPEHDGFEYIGMRFWWPTEDTPLTWGVANTTKWSTTVQTEERQSAREWASWLGRMMFAAHLSCQPLCVMPEGVDLLRAVSAVGKQGAESWDKEVDMALVEPDLHGRLCQLWRRITEGDGWRHDGRQVDDSTAAALLEPTEIRYVMASDASMTGQGFLLYERDPGSGALNALEGREVRERQQYAGELLKTHIYLKEMRTAVMALLGYEKYWQRMGKPLPPVLLAVDNSAVAWGLAQGFTTHPEGMSLIRLVAHLLPRVRIMLVASAHNPADPLSRKEIKINDTELLQRESLFERAVAADFAGTAIGRPGNTFGRKQGGQRHVVPRTRSRKEPTAGNEQVNTEDSDEDEDFLGFEDLCIATDGIV